MSVVVVRSEEIARTRCRHFTGTWANTHCAAGVEYDAVTRHHAPVSYRIDHAGGTLPGEVHQATVSRPCLGSLNLGGATCPRYAPIDPAEATERTKQLEHALDLMRRGRSSCCEAPLDESWVDPVTGHGIRYCAKCQRVAFYV
jgi:hypothetical protein